MKKLTTINFTNKALDIHSKKYDYSNVIYVNNKTKVSIDCPIHGKFLQRPDRHLQGEGCPNCGGTKNKSNKDCIIDFRKIHGDTYDYSKIEYINSKTKIDIICSDHGLFKQTANNHLKGKGCPKCGKNSQAANQRIIPINLKDLTKSIRRLIANCYNRKGFTKKSKTSEILGCTWEEFKNHLEDNPYGFKVDQKGLDLDHIIPISSVKSEEDIIKLNHYTNFQLLPSDYNRWIKSCKLFNKDHFEEWFIRKYSYDS